MLSSAKASKFPTFISFLSSISAVQTGYARTRYLVLMLLSDYGPASVLTKIPSSKMNPYGSQMMESGASIVGGMEHIKKDQALNRSGVLRYPVESINDKDL
ncbi:MAG: hypothetical protein ACYCR7_01045 [Thermoplasmataceae archaeon]